MGETVSKKSSRVATVVSEEGGDSGESGGGDSVEGVRRVVTVVRGMGGDSGEGVRRVVTVVRRSQYRHWYEGMLLVCRHS